MEALKINKMVKKYNGFTLDIENLIVEKGYITGFIGKNGSGKTTTIKSILGLVIPEECNMEVLGHNLLIHPEIKEQIGYVGNVSGFLEESSLKLIKKSISIFYTKWDESKYAEYMKVFGLNENKKYGQLSQGQKKQFELILALCHHPKLLIMDEPTANLDPIVRNQIIDIVKEIIEKEEMSVFFSTQITSDLDKCSDYIVFINNGKIILYGEKDKLCENHVIVKGKNEIIDNDIKNEFISINCTEYGFAGMIDNREKAYELFGEEAVYEKCSLEDLMLYYTSGGIKNE